jgi:CRISPR/Cas system-associated exonuclease Cas4 (RecB family)
LYDPSSGEPYKISRSKIDLFHECPRCFYFDKRLGISRPSGPAFSLNSAVDALLKKEFDLLRLARQPHELMRRYHIDAVPFVHKDLDLWRENFVGKQYLHEKTNLIIFGAVDDIWINPAGELIIVDYKSTSTEKEISLDDEWKQGYKRQLEIYQWIFRSSGFAVSPTAYIVYANATKERKQFDGKLEFKLTLHPHVGNDRWIEPTIMALKECLDAKGPPQPSPSCEYCKYRSKASEYDSAGQLKLY